MVEALHEDIRIRLRAQIYYIELQLLTVSFSLSVLIYKLIGDINLSIYFSWFIVNWLSDRMSCWIWLVIDIFINSFTFWIASIFKRI